jgi:hypothetical protein
MAEPTSLRKATQGKRTLIQYTIVAIVCVFASMHFARSWNEIRGYQWRFNYIYLLITLVLGMLTQIAVAYGWCLVLGSLQCKMSLTKSLKIMSLASLAKYLPGMGWDYLAQANMCEKEGIRKARGAASIVLERTICFVGGVFAFLIALIFWRHATLGAGSYLILFTIPVGLVFIHPRVFSLLMNLGLRLFKRREIDMAVRYKDIVFLTGFYVLIWGVGGIAFYFFVQSLFPVQLNPVVAVGILAISVNVGFLTPFMPGGLVVREAMLTSLLQAYMPMNAAIMVAIAYRFLNSIRELIFAAIATRL